MQSDLAYLLQTLDNCNLHYIRYALGFNKVLCSEVTEKVRDKKKEVERTEAVEGLYNRETQKKEVKKWRLRKWGDFSFDWKLCVEFNLQR